MFLQWYIAFISCRYQPLRAMRSLKKESVSLLSHILPLPPGEGWGEGIESNRLPEFSSPHPVLLPEGRLQGCTQIKGSEYSIQFFMYSDSLVASVPWFLGRIVIDIPSPQPSPGGRGSPPVISGKCRESVRGNARVTIVTSETSWKTRNELEDYDFPARAIEESLSRLPETLRKA